MKVNRFLYILAAIILFASGFLVSKCISDSKKEPQCLNNFVEVNPDSVYLVTSGKCYHSTLDCAALRRSHRIKTITLNEAESRHKRPCSLCIDSETIIVE